MSRFFSAFSAEPKLEPQPAVRDWRALGRLLLPGRAAPAKPRLQALLRDEFADVRIVAAVALALHGETAAARATLAEIIGGGQPYEVLAVLNALEFASRSGTPRSRAPAMVRDRKPTEPAERIPTDLLGLK